MFHNVPAVTEPTSGRQCGPDVGSQGCTTCAQGCTTVEGSSHEGAHNNSLQLRIPLPSCSRHGAHLCPTPLGGSAQLQPG